MALRQLALAILLQVVGGHRRAVDARGVYQMVSDAKVNLSAQQVAGSLESTRNVEEAENKSDVEDGKIKDASAMQQTKKRVDGWNEGAVAAVAAQKARSVKVGKKKLFGRRETRLIPAVPAVPARAGKLTTFQQAPGWCYANAVSAMHRYYHDGQKKQCDMANDICSMFFNKENAGCCAGTARDGNYPQKTRRPNDDFFVPPKNSFTSYHLVFSGQKECCGEWGTYIPDRHTAEEAFGRKVSYGPGEGKTWLQLVAAIDANKPFIGGTNNHYKVCYGYIVGSEILLCHDGYYHHGGETGEVQKTYSEYLEFLVKTHFQE